MGLSRDVGEERLAGATQARRPARPQAGEEHLLLRLQRRVGNQAVTRLLARDATTSRGPSGGTARKASILVDPQWAWLYRPWGGEARAQTRALIYSWPERGLLTITMTGRSGAVKFRFMRIPEPGKREMPRWWISSSAAIGMAPTSARLEALLENAHRSTVRGNTGHGRDPDIDAVMEMLKEDARAIVTP